MALAISFDEAKKNRRHQAGDPTRGTSGGITNTPFFNFRDDPDLPHATLSERDPGRLSRTHFHLRDQFQVVVAGRGSLGRHELKPYGVHFSRAYTPYGPLLADAVNPMAFFVMRAHRDPGSQRLPQELEKLKSAVRRPWQITRTVSFESLHSAAATRDVVQEPIPGIVDERGLAAYTLTLRPHAQTMGPDASSGDGQYVVVVRGSVLYGGNEHKALALVFVQPQESALRIHAGPEGLDAIVLNFPRVEAPPLEKPAALPATQSSSRRFQCDMCAFAYDEAAGLPADGIAPGTRWEDVPESWNCPDCGASKSDFRAMS